MRIFSLGLIGLCLAACSFPGVSVSNATPEPASAVETAMAITSATVETPHPTPTAPALGTVENPLILALLPAANVEGTRVQAGKAFAEQLSEMTGYSFVVVVPESYSRLVAALGRGNAHLAVLSPYAYAVSYLNGYANAAFASVISGEKTYGAQFIARPESGFMSYFDPYRKENTADAGVALSQFRDKKPCWPDEVSPSGYVVPLGVLKQNDISLRKPAFLQGQPTVVRAVYAGGICDFGATYVDARDFPSVQDAYPDVEEQVQVIWRIPAVIPHEVFILNGDLPPDIAQSLKDAIFRVSGMQAGKKELDLAYGIEVWEPVNDMFYEQFLLYLNASGIDLESILD